MLAPASKKVATGGPFGSNGNGAVAGSSETPPRAPACGPSPVSGPRAAPPGAAFAPPACPPPAPARPPRPPPRGGPLLARIQTPEKSILPSAVRGGGASARTRPCASRGTDGSTTFGHCAPSDTEQAT